MCQLPPFFSYSSGDSGGHSVITAITQGDNHPSMMYLNISKQNLETGEEYNKSNKKTQQMLGVLESFF